MAARLPSTALYKATIRHLQDVLQEEFAGGRQRPAVPPDDADFGTQRSLVSHLDKLADRELFQQTAVQFCVFQRSWTPISG